MQWLIDIIIEAVIAAIGIPPVFIDRGDPAAADYVTGDFIKDETWRELDLSAIVPEGAQAVTCFVLMKAVLTGKFFAVKKGGQVNGVNISQIMSIAAGVYNTADFTVAVDSNRKVEYYAKAGVYTVLNVTVKGWWL